MDEIKRIKSYFEEIVELIKDHISDDNTEENLLLYYFACIFKIWGSNVLFSKDYVSLVNIILNKVELFKSKAKIVHEEIEKIRNSFPFNALPMLSSQEKIDEYMAELRIRGKICANEKQELEKKIMNLTGGTVNG